MSYIEAVRSGFNNYANFAGRAARSEYWYWTLFNLLMSILAGILDMVIGLGIFGVIVTLGLLLPSIAVSVRRLHDIDRTGWWLLIAFTGIGAIVLIVWACLQGTPGANRFGADPLTGRF